MTLVSIVTPTKLGRESLLIDRCIPSVRALDWLTVEHVIVSDRNPGLAEKMIGLPGVRFVELNEAWRDGIRDRGTGAFPWMIGSYLALGEFVGFLGDDDELLSDHAARHITVMRDDGLDFTISPVLFRVANEDRMVIGDSSMSHGHLDSDGIMCRATALRVATWVPDGTIEGDAQLIADWLGAGLRGRFIGGPPTAIHHDGWAAG